MENNSLDAGPSSALDQENSEIVLNEVLVNRSALRQAVTTGQPVEDQDLALAKLLQQQERAFLSITGFQGPAENVPPPSGQADSSERRSPSPSDGDAPDAANRPLTDEELAWKLMQEEEAEFQRRMMALAGVQYPGTSPRGGTHGPVQTWNNEGVAVNDDENLENYSEEDEDDLDSDDDIPDPDSMSYEELTLLGEVAGTVSTGLKEGQISTLPVMKYSKACLCKNGGAGDGGEEEKDEEEQCAVCRVEFEGEDEVTQLPCGHYYHPECVGQWLQQKKTCPQCNREVLPTQNGGETGVAAENTTAPTERLPLGPSILGSRNM